MILRRLIPTAFHSEPRPPFEVFLESQKHVAAPYAAILQPEHARLAGRIAERLLPEHFGPLPAEVIAAIADHDLGWRTSDDEQIRRAPSQDPRPFPEVEAEEAMRTWRESIRLAKEKSPLRAAVVSRHFRALASNDTAYQPFLVCETPKAERLEHELKVTPAELDRWTDAIGFCDILSLLLCSGSEEPAMIPLAHPALLRARDQPAVFLGWAGGQPRFSFQVLREGTEVSAAGLERRENGAEFRPASFSWQFP
jgi:hypothetical protein